MASGRNALDQDGDRDLVFWNEGHFEVHRQDERGLFSPVAETFTTEVVIDSDDLSSLAVGDMTGRVLHSLTDLNSDDVADLVVVSLEGASISNKRSSYEVHLGVPTPEGGTAFERGVDIAFRKEEKIQPGMDRLDLDRDGRICLMFTTIAPRGQPANVGLPCSLCACSGPKRRPGSPRARDTLFNPARAPGARPALP